MVSQVIGKIPLLFKLQRLALQLRYAPTASQVQTMLFTSGVCLIVLGQAMDAEAYTQVANYNDDRIAESVDLILTYVNGTFGALIMVSAGIAAILASAFGQYRAALGLLVVAVGSFILRSLVSTWFNVESLQPPEGQ